jgi:hypothetical protein
MKASENKNVKLKPQPKHLRTRVDYLIKVLQNQINIEKFGPEWKEKQQLTNKSSRSKKKQTNEVDGADSTINMSFKNNSDPNSTVTVSKSSKKKNALKDADSKANLNQRSSKKSKRNHDHVRDLNESDNSDSNSDTKVKICFIDKSRLKI